jgi:hypothetical protein
MTHAIPFRPILRAVLASILALSILLPAAPPVRVARAQDPQPDLLAACGLGQIKSSHRATIQRSSVIMTPGPLFSTSGSFSAKEVDSPCDPGHELGPFPVIAGGTLSAHIVGNPPVPNQMSLGNRNTSLHIVYEPLIGGEFGPSSEILSLAGQAEDNDLSGGASWPGSGRLRAYIGAPGGAGPLTSVCYEQSYSAQAEIVEVSPAMPAQPGLDLFSGDTIETDGWGTLTLTLPDNGTGIAIYPSSQVSLQAGEIAPAPGLAGDSVGLDLPEHTLGLPDKAREFERARLPMPQGYYDGTPDDFWKRYRAGTRQDAFARIRDLSDPCEAAVQLKLFLEAH